MVSIVEKPLGRALLTLSFFAVLYSFRWSAFDTMDVRWPNLVALALLIALPFSLLTNLGIAALWTYFFDWQITLDFPTPVWTQRDQALIGAKAIQQELAGPFSATRIGVLITTVILIGLVSKMLLKLKPRMPIAWLFPVWLIWLYALLALPPETGWLVLSRDTFFYFSAALLPLCFLTLNTAQAPQLKWFERIAFALQSTLFYVQPKFVFLENAGQAQSARDRSTAETADCRVRGLKLIIWVRLLVLLKDLVRWQVFSVWQWPNYFTMGLADYNALHVPALESWCLIFINTASNLVSLTKFSGVTVGAFRLAGIYLPRNTYRIHRAKTFIDYYRRCFYYYSEIIVHLFFIPILRQLRRVSSNRAAMGVALFLAVYFGGWIFHLLLITKQFFLFPYADVIENLRSWSLYFAAVAVACCLSASGIFSRVINPRWPWPAHFAINFFFHCMLNTLFTYSLHVTWDNRLEFYKSLLGP